MSSAISLAESFLQSGNVAAAYKVLQDFPEPTARRDLLLARCALRLNDPTSAVAALSTANAREPRNAEVAAMLGDLYTRLGWADKADAFYSKFLKKTEDEQVRVQYGCLLYARKRQEAALAEWNKVLARNPRNALALLYRADVMAAGGRNDEAVQNYRALLAAHPDNADGWAKLGIVEIWRGKAAMAAEALREAVRLRPGSGEWLLNLALALTMSGQVDEAKANFARLREVDLPRWQELQATTHVEGGWEGGEEIDPRPFFLLFCYGQMKDCDWTYHSAFDDIFRDYVREPQGNPMALIHASGVAALDTAERVRLASLAGQYTGAGCVPFVHAPSPTPARLRVGYAMPHLGAHVVAWIIDRLLQAHDRDAVEIHLISLNMDNKDYTSDNLARLRQIPGVSWLDVTGLTQADAAARIHALGLDVLVDMAVYNDQARPRVFAHRPTPVQVNWLGAPFSSGAPWMDYIITDPVVSPGRPGWCTEAEVRMPVCYFAFGGDEAVPPAPLPREQAGVPAGKFLYSVMHNGYKLDPQTVERWLRILKATPDSVLWFRGGDKQRANLAAFATAHGVDPARLLFAANVPNEIYLARQGTPDLFLDARLYNGHTTMAESLWMGVLGLTCPGDSFQNRVGASLLASCGLQELIMPDWDSYEATAIALYHDRARLAALREKLRAARLSAAPFDMPGQARALEKAFRHMRDRFARGEAPAPFDIAALS